MNRLQKKCIIVTAGLHLLLLAVLAFGPAFFNREPKNDNLPVLDMIPANVIDAAFNSGVKNAAPPPPQPPVMPQPQPQPPQPQQAQPVPNVKLVQPAPAPTPKPSITTEIARWFTPAPKPEPEKPTTEQNQPHKIVVSTQLVTGSPQKITKPQKSPNDSQAINNALTSLRQNLHSSSTKIDLSGDSSVAYANYASVLKSVYDAAWILPTSINADENIKVSVTIARDGSVISSHIETPSGDVPADDSVQRALDRVQFVHAFPDDWTDSQRTFVIDFNPQVKNSE